VVTYKTIRREEFREKRGFREGESWYLRWRAATSYLKIQGEKAERRDIGFCWGSRLVVRTYLNGGRGPEGGGFDVADRWGC